MIGCCAVMLALMLVRPAVAMNRFTAVWADGTRQVADEIQNWHDPSALPQFNGRAMLDPNSPIRWVCDTTLKAAQPPDAYVEFFGGDLLPGRVVGYQREISVAHEPWPAMLLVEPAIMLDWPEASPRRFLKILPDAVRRIVWQPMSGAIYQPGTLFYADGRQLAFRSVRFTSGGVRLLLEQGTADVAFDQVAELHLPAVDTWELYLQQLAVLTPESNSLLMRMETSQGMKLTCSVERLMPRTRGGNEPQHWIHAVQPAWSLDPLFVPHRTVRMRHFFAPHEVPLTWLEPQRVAQRSALGSGWQVIADRNTQAGPLRAAGLPYGWGWGVHAHNELEFALPEQVRSFRTMAALDQVAGRGGCARVRVFLNDTNSQPIYESPHLIGTATPLDTGRIALQGAAAGQKHLILQADAAHEGRPTGSDPLDIRDAVDWLEPLLEVDPVWLKSALHTRALDRVLAGFEASITNDTATLRIKNVWDLVPAREGGFRLNLLSAAPGVTVSAAVTVDAQHDYLTIIADRNGMETHNSRIDVYVNDGVQPVTTWEVPDSRANANNPDPLQISLTDFLGETIQIHLKANGPDDRSWFDLRGLAITDRPTGLQKLFTSDTTTAEAMLPAGRATLAAEGFSDSHSLLIPSGPAVTWTIPSEPVLIREHPRVGEYRFLCIAWRKKGGGRMMLGLGHDGKFGPSPDNPNLSFTFDAGQGDACVEKAVRCYGDVLHDQWYVQNLDLYGPFGNFALTGLALGAPDGDAIQFDHCYLARRPDDFRWIATELANQATARRLERIQPYLNVETSDSVQAAKLVAAYAPDLTARLQGDSQQVALLPRYRHRVGVLRTVHGGPEQPCLLTARLMIPNGRRSLLSVPVSHQENGDWQLRISANNEVIHDSVVGAASAPNGWQQVTLDLTRFAGQAVALEMLHVSNGGENEQAYWGGFDWLTE